MFNSQSDGFIDAAILGAVVAGPSTYLEVGNISSGERDEDSQRVS